MNHGSTNGSGVVEAIFIARSPAGAMEERRDVQAVAGRGIAGDRYGEANGTFSKGDRVDQQITLIEAEAIDAARRDYQLDYSPIDSRRNVLTRGIALNHLVGREFTVGGARCRGVKLAEPCGHMEKLCGKEGARKSLIHRGGLRAEVIGSGTIKVGDAVRAG
jgi:MOSC domain-containing protein YiiM